MGEKIIVEVDQFLKDIVPKFLQARRDDMGNLQQLLQKQSWNEIQSIAHKIKGNAGSYGLTYLGDLGAQLETACKTQKTSIAPELVAKMKDYLEKVEIQFVSKSDEDDEDDEEDDD